MRVIGGKAKGHRLLSVPGRGVRPITDRVKSALFDILSNRVEGAVVLDLFAGTGSVGIEALSRGARRAVFVEKDPAVVRVLRENLRRTGLEAQAEVVQDDVFRFLKRPPPQRFDIIYIAPPQYRGLWSQTLLALDGGDFLAPDGVAVVQIFPKEFEELTLKQLMLEDKRKYGSTLLCFYSKVEARPSGPERGCEDPSSASSKKP
ncbi:MAG: 16S rRNA (guanine(966)-N(2))-methyltransferase RsmD [Chloroflexi bacterium]|nr:MAG: 16S rRNA (guanine(966)-N(2))-methyltransferase RsmD [Chloroflexota bacterium]